jgi:hypothetical protein
MPQATDGSWRPITLSLDRRPTAELIDDRSKPPSIGLDTVL